MMHGTSRVIVCRSFPYTLVMALLFVALASLAGAQDVSAAPADLGTRTINQGDTLSVSAPNGMVVKLFISGGTKPFLSATAQSVKVTFNKVGTFPLAVYNGTGTLEETGTLVVTPAQGIVAGVPDFVSLPPPAPCSTSTEIRTLAADCIAPSASAAPPPDFVPEVSIISHEAVPSIDAPAPVPAASPAPDVAPPPAPIAASPAPPAAASSPLPAAPPRVALPSAPRTGGGGAAAYINRLGDG